MSATAEPAAVSPPPRLMISQMVLENFKSYYGVKTCGPFHKCFTSGEFIPLGSSYLTNEVTN